MAGTGPWLAGIVAGLLSLLGLVVASQAQDGPYYVGGLLLFLFGVLFIFFLIGRYTGRPPKK